MREAPRKTQLSRKGDLEEKEARGQGPLDPSTSATDELDLNGGATGFISGVLALERKR